MDNTIKMVTTPRSDGTIEQYVTIPGFGPGSMREEIMRQLIRTQEEHIKQALIQLGWTPPPTQRVTPPEDANHV